MFIICIYKFKNWLYLFKDTMWVIYVSGLETKQVLPPRLHFFWGGKFRIYWTDQIHMLWTETYARIPPSQVIICCILLNVFWFSLCKFV